MTVDLHHRHFVGPGPDLVILHGIFGSHKNWISAAGRFAEKFNVYTLDARNHGDSPHSSSHTLTDMVDDLVRWLDRQAIKKPILLGHSMGGLTVMASVLGRTLEPAAVIVVDIAPRPYRRGHEEQILALEMDVSHYASRAELDRDMTALLPDTTVRRFLQMNLERRGEGYGWKINVSALKKSVYTENFASLMGKTWDGPALFLVGGRSEFITGEDLRLIPRTFPRARIAIHPRADHWLHYTFADWFYERATEFMEREL